ncbi:MAG: hypothetical protein N2171_00085 [Clostridia bacterium]|nr:hypothetical protein [Clostridia bacterium]
MEAVYSTIEFYNELKLKYKDYMKPEIVSVVMIQSADEVFLEILEIEIVEGGFEKQTKRRVNLDFIADDNSDEDQIPFFNPKDPIEKNVNKFINELTPYSIINTTTLFHDEACEKINRKYNTFGVDG